MAPTDKNAGARIGRRLFSEVLGELASGDVDKEATTLLAELVTACEQHGKKGTITLTLTVNPTPKMMAITTDIKTTIPRAPLEATSFFTDDKGGLHLENPKQMKMFNPPVAVPDPNKGSDN